ncbi:hypothetical protein EVAR_10502_1 [Eumeta japonica]|uniref:Uncharacterized protein n=1 Tax=Eumeta variegata TaxID=151549 RepID=A0A4C1TK17_EUMVA|nr:hypothetical protein EVAR_10502_1 [Eumeta japonica]
MTRSHAPRPGSAFVDSVPSARNAHTYDIHDFIRVVVMRSETSPKAEITTVKGSEALSRQNRGLRDICITTHFSSRVGCVRPLSLFYLDASADGAEERSLVPRSRSHARLRRKATMSHAFSCVQPAFIDL